MRFFSTFSRSSIAFNLVTNAATTLISTSVSNRSFQPQVPRRNFSNSVYCPKPTPQGYYYPPIRALMTTQLIGKGERVHFISDSYINLGKNRYVLDCKMNAVVPELPNSLKSHINFTSVIKNDLNKIILDQFKRPKHRYHTITGDVAKKLKVSLIMKRGIVITNIYMNCVRTRS